jgi:hypothetical protein
MLSLCQSFFFLSCKEQVVTQEGKVEGGEGVPKSISALKQAWREEEKQECETFWRWSLVEAVFAPLTLVHPVLPSPNTATPSLAETPLSSLAFVSTSTTQAPPNPSSP